MTLKKKDLLFPELSYQIVGACFDAYNEIGSGHKEKYYQKAVAVHLKLRSFKFKEQASFPIMVKEQAIGNYFFDFVVDDSVVVELKVGRRYRKQDYEQIKRYLSHSKIGLGLLVRFDESGVTFQRVLRPHS